MFLLSKINIISDNLKISEPKKELAKKYLIDIVDLLNESIYPNTCILPFLFTLVPNIKNKLHKIAYYIDNNNVFLPYHSNKHTAKVTLFAALIGQYHNLSNSKMELLIKTAMLHDLNYDKNIKNMESKSINMAFSLGFVDFNEFNTIDNLNQATNLIKFRKEYSKYKENSLEVILSDSDLIGSVAISKKEYDYQSSLLLKENDNIISKEELFKIIGNLKSVKDTIFEENFIQIKS